MAKIYISSTFTDLLEYRAKVIETLLSLGHKVMNMENYVAEDKLPIRKCLEDIEQCDIYVGIFAWRYGYVPSKNNKEKLSITEQEYRHAKKNNLSLLIFMLDPSVNWLPENMDAFTGENDKGEKINGLRQNFKENKLLSSFSSPDDLARKISVSISLSIAETRQQAAYKTENFTDVERSPLGLSLTPQIIESITLLMLETKNSRVLDINLHNGDYWWSTRLFLLSALVVDYTPVKCFAFFYNNQFIGLATPHAMLQSLAGVFPKIAKAYYGTLEQDNPLIEEKDKIIQRVQRFSMALGQLEGGESANKVIVNKKLLDRWLGKSFKTDFIETNKPGIDTENTKQILNTDFPFVPLVNKKMLVSIIDKNEFAQNIARSVVNL